MPLFSQNIGTDLPECEEDSDIWAGLTVAYKTWVSSYEREQEDHTFFNRLSGGANDEFHKAGTCLKPCSSRSYEVQATPASYMGEQLAFGLVGGFQMWPLDMVLLPFTQPQSFLCLLFWGHRETELIFIFKCSIRHQLSIAQINLRQVRTPRFART